MDTFPGKAPLSKMFLASLTTGSSLNGKNSLLRSGLLPFGVVTFLEGVQCTGKQIHVESPLRYTRKSIKLISPCPC